MSKTVRISEEFYALIDAHNLDGETMEEMLRRLIGGPDPEEVAGILSTDTAERMRERTRVEDAAEEKRELRERFE